MKLELGSIVQEAPAVRIELTEAQLELIVAAGAPQQQQGLFPGLAGLLFGGGGGRGGKK